MVMLTFLNYERSYVKILKKNISNFEFALSRAKTRQAAQEQEPFYVQRNLQSIIQHLRDIKNANPKITHDEMQTILFDEIDKYSQCVFENSFVFTESMEYFVVDIYNLIKINMMKSHKNFNKLILSH